ncbi:MAG: hypothetical protein PWP34_2291 [Desulfuromonadales bacterium]|jgi:hypothetical protein|nr:hypothetical protein [Desulfuromonadales bacterium]
MCRLRNTLPTADHYRLSIREPRIDTVVSSYKETGIFSL